MRAAILGAGGLGVTTAEILLRRGIEVVVIDVNKDLLQTLADRLDCGLIHGDGTKPAILREAGPERCDLLLCLTGNDRDNILASLVGRHLGFHRVVTKIEDPEFEPICAELGLDDAIIPDRAVARSLADLAAGHGVPDLSALIRDDFRFFSFVAQGDDAVRVEELGLPKRTRLIGVSRGERFLLLGSSDALHEGDVALLITAADELDGLRGRWAPGKRD